MCIGYTACLKINFTLLKDLMIQINMIKRSNVTSANITEDNTVCGFICKPKEFGTYFEGKRETKVLVT